MTRPAGDGLWNATPCSLAADPVSLVVEQEVGAPNAPARISMLT